MNRFNIRQFAWFLVLLSFSFFLIYLLLSKKIYIFINPKMVKYTTIAAICFVFLTVFQARKIFTISRNNKFRAGYLLFVLPLILGLNTNGFNSGIVNKKSLTIAEKQASENSDLKNFSFSNNYGGKVKHYIKENKVVFNEKNYFDILKDISENLDEYEGKEIQLVGFVYRDKEFGKNRFVIARMLMTCCAADSQVVGLMSEYPSASSLKEGEWIKVQGIISDENHMGKEQSGSEEMPVIQVKKVVKCAKPYGEYIYS